LTKRWLGVILAPLRGMASGWRGWVKIERITPVLVDRCLLVRVYTDEGLVGTGEAGLW
jgi:L-alanine-DL-glutamate epimerase-like enolase superfamily enzyme